MSASICWRPADPKPKRLSVGAPSAFMETMTRAGMALPCTLTEAEVPILRGMAATWRHEGTNPYEQILDAIGAYSIIELWPEY